MHIINITVRDKIATNLAQDRYVCGNSDYIVRFDFDAEWDAYETKTARFIKEDGTVYDQVFTGSDCPVPVISDTYKLMVGAYAGNLSTTTAAYVPCKKSILCGGGTPAAPAEDVYSQVMDALNKNTEAAKEAMSAVDAGESGIYLVRATPDPDFRNFPRSDRTQEEIRAAVAAGKTVLMVYTVPANEHSGAHTARVMTYAGEFEHSSGICPTFDGFIDDNSDGIPYYYQTFVQSSGIVGRSGSVLRAATKRSLKLTGAVEATFDGREEVTVEIPSGIEDPGTAHQMLVSDADGKAVWTDLLAYKTTGTVELLGETVLPVTDEEGMFFLTSPLAALPENGKTYKVTYNGEVRETPCLVRSQSGVTVAILGDGSSFGLENDTDAPFAIGIPMDDASFENSGFHLLYISKVEFTGDLTLSISGEATSVKKIDPEYLPDSAGKQIVLTINEDGTVTSDTDFATAWSMTAAQLQAAITVKDTGYFFASGATRKQGALVVTKYENTVSGQLLQQIQVQWQEIIGDTSDMQMDTSTKFLAWNANGISAGGTLIPGLPLKMGLQSGMYMRYNGTKWMGVTVDELKADLGLT